MNTETPMILMLDKNPLGKIISYSYSTPWAEGKIELAEDEDLSRLVGACEFLDWIEELPEGHTKEEDQDYYAELERRGLTELDVDTITHGNWQIVTKDNEEHKIHWPKFDRAGFITWRW